MIEKATVRSQDARYVLEVPVLESDGSWGDGAEGIQTYGTGQKQRPIWAYKNLATLTPAPPGRPRDWYLAIPTVAPSRRSRRT